MADDRYPRGKLNADDEGQLEMAFGVHRNTVVIRFGAPLTWVGMSAAVARDFARKLNEMADKIEN